MRSATLNNNYMTMRDGFFPLVPDVPERAVRGFFFARASGES